MDLLLMVPENLFYAFFLCVRHTGIKYIKKPRIILFEIVKKSILSHISFYVVDNDYKAIDFNGETMSFICQLIKN